MPTFVVNKACLGQTAPVLSLLPELMSAETLPEHFIVAHPHNEPSHILGAAAFIPKLQNTERAGFIFHCRVIPAYKNKGIGRALIQQLATEVASWDVDYLHTASTYGDESPVASFLTNLGFTVNASKRHFISDADPTVPMLQRLVKALYARGRVPNGFIIKPLSETDPDIVANLFCRQFGGSIAYARSQVKQALEDPSGKNLSLSLSNGDQLAGFLIGSHDNTTPEVKYWVTDPNFGQGWAATLLLEGFVSRGYDLGFSQGRYSCNDKNRATLNIARKTGARLEFVDSSYVLDLKKS